MHSLNHAVLTCSPSDLLDWCIPYYKGLLYICKKDRVIENSVTLHEVLGSKNNGIWVPTIL